MAPASADKAGDMIPGQPATPKRRLPEWLKKTVPLGAGEGVRVLLDDLRLNTVCKSARCPNCFECYHKKRATFLIMGPNCTRQCRFCAVDKLAPAPLDPDEPARVAEAVSRLGLKHAVVTSVTRDDLADGGAAHFAAVIRAIRARSACTIEVLTPDFSGLVESLKIVAEAAPEIFNHNIETVARLYEQIRPQANYRQSLRVLRFMADHSRCVTKSGIMAGLGETLDEILQTARDLREAGVQALTVGQYLAPSDKHAPVVEYLRPEVFDEIGRQAKALGFAHVASAPFVRSSYNAEEALAEIREGAKRQSGRGS